jgi:hypothetical protein
MAPLNDPPDPDPVRGCLEQLECHRLRHGERLCWTGQREIVLDWIADNLMGVRPSGGFAHFFYLQK